MHGGKPACLTMSETRSAADKPTGDLSVGRLSVGRRVQFALGLCGLVVALAYVGSVVVRAYAYYRDLSSGKYVWSAPAHVPHPTMGYVTAPNVEGVMRFGRDAEIPLRHDARSMRVPAANLPQPPETGPRIMAFGDSWTYGYRCPAEDVYVERVAAALDGRAINAGVSGYGLAECVLRARLAIPEHRPDIVLVQTSPWLIQRSLSPIQKGLAGLKARPHFGKGGDGSIEILPPVFETVFWDLPLYRYMQRGEHRPGFATFLRQVGWRRVSRDDLHLLQYRVQQRWGTLADLPDDRLAVLRLALGEIAAVCAQNDAQMIVLYMWWPLDGQPDFVEADLGLPEAQVVNVTGALLAELPEPRLAAYEGSYAFRHGNPPRKVDGHPNPDAHAAMAAVIVDALGGAGISGRQSAP